MTSFLKTSILPGGVVPEHKHHRMIVILIILLVIAVVIGISVYFGYNQGVFVNYAPTSRDNLVETKLKEVSKSSLKLSEQEKLKRLAEVNKARVPLSDEQKRKILEEVNNFNTNR